MSIKIDGKKISQEIGERLFLELQEKNLVNKVSLGILLVGDDPASISFINVKKKFGEKYGFVVNVEKFEPGLIDAKEQIKETLIRLQKENNAVILQLPLPENLRFFTDEILNTIEKGKDVDNLNGGNFTAPIVLALKKILNNVDYISKKQFGIVGLGQVVGMPIYNYLVENNFKVIKIERENFQEIKNCDVVISGVGQANLIKENNIKEGAALIDYGCSWNREKFCGDFDESCYTKSSFYTPVPGCMGPLVVASLFENVLLSAKVN